MTLNSQVAEIDGYECLVCGSLFKRFSTFKHHDCPGSEPGR